MNVMLLEVSLLSWKALPWIIVVVGLVALSLWNPRRRMPQGRSDLLAEKYRVMTKEKLAETPDEELADAVVANLLEKVDKRRPDPYLIVPQLSRGRCAVYSVWLLCKELDAGSFEEFYRSGPQEFDELASDGMALIGATECAAVLNRARELAMCLEEAEEELAQLHADFLEAMEKEAPLMLCARYIRDFPDEFCDAEGAEV